jgi:hypothetical protein
VELFGEVQHQRDAGDQTDHTGRPPDSLRDGQRPPGDDGPVEPRRLLDRSRLRLRHDRRESLKQRLGVEAELHGVRAQKSSDERVGRQDVEAFLFQRGEVTGADSGSSRGVGER